MSITATLPINVTVTVDRVNLVLAERAVLFARHDDGTVTIAIDGAEVARYNAFAAHLIAGRLYTATETLKAALSPAKGTIGLTDEFGGDGVYVHWDISPTDEVVNVGDYADLLVAFLQGA